MTKQKIIFWIVYPLIFLISKTPLWLLYGLSNLLYYLVYYLIGYRKNIVKRNLKLCFPNQSAKERLKIEKKSYRHFVDIFIEMLKGFSISQKELNKRYKYTNPEIFKTLENTKKSVIVLGTHYGNWEWLFNVNSQTNLKCYGAYKKVKNKYFDKCIKKNRGRFGSELVSTEKTIPKITNNYRKGVLAIYGLLSDQSPQIHKTHYWASFFGNVVPIHTGAEMLAKRFDFEVIYMHVSMPKRGYYEIAFENITQTHNLASEYPITDLYLKKLEQDITQRPELYFWTHDRFKHLNKNNIKHAQTI